MTTYIEYYNTNSITGELSPQLGTDGLHRCDQRHNLASIHKRAIERNYIKAEAYRIVSNPFSDNPIYSTPLTELPQCH